MLVVAISAFWIHEIRLWGPWSPIHLLVDLHADHAAARHLRAPARHNVRGHKLTMLGIFLGALVIAGLFTFFPGRIMYKVVFGG